MPSDYIKTEAPFNFGLRVKLIPEKVKGKYDLEGNDLSIYLNQELRVIKVMGYRLILATELRGKINYTFYYKDVIKK